MSDLPQINREGTSNLVAGSMDDIHPWMTDTSIEAWTEQVVVKIQEAIQADPDRELIYSLAWERREELTQDAAEDMAEAQGVTVETARGHIEAARTRTQAARDGLPEAPEAAPRRRGPSL